MKNSQNKNIFFKKTGLKTLFVFFAFTFIYYPCVVFGLESKLSLDGECVGDLKIELRKKEDLKNIAYTSGVKCVDGKFNFNDDLFKWNLPDGQYVVMVNGERVDDNVVFMDHSAISSIEKNDRKAVETFVTEQNKAQAPETSGNDQSDQEENADVADVAEVPIEEFQTGNEFDKAVGQFNMSMDQMNKSLEVMDSSYGTSKYASSSFARTIIDLMKETLKTISGLFVQLVTTQGDNDDVQAVENNVVEESVNTDSSAGVETGEIQSSEAE